MYTAKSDKEYINLQIKNGFLLRKVADSFVVVPVGGELNFNGLITLNETGAFLWRLLEKGTTREELIDQMEEAYDADRECIAADVDALLQKMDHAGLLKA